jgi:CubicO group peptidase (beta-lactamase class C family)
MTMPVRARRSILAPLLIAICALVVAPATAAPPSLDAAALQAIYSDMAKDSHADLKGIVIMRDGAIESEHYFNGDDASTLHDIRSATKSITALLMGIAIRKNLVKGIDEPIGSYLPGLPRDGKEKITIRDLLNMRSGLDADDDDASSPGNEDALNRSSDWIRSVYAVPVKAAPGKEYVYASINAFLAGVIIENASHMSLDAFAKSNLLEPLGIRRFNWERAPINRTTGQGNFSITARDAAAIGQLMLDGGSVRGRRIVATEWIEASWSRQVTISNKDPYADFYGFMWYTKDEPVGAENIEVHFASGNGGNKIYVIPSLRLVVAITSSAYGHGYGQRRSQEILLRLLAATR